MRSLNFIKKHPISVLIIFLIIPLILSISMNGSVFSHSRGSVEGWLGFWGSYIGGTLGALGVIITTYFLIEAEKQNLKEVAKLNDQTERDRINTIFLLNKNEELLKVLSEISKLNNSRYNSLRSYVRLKKQLNECNSRKDDLTKLKIIYGQNTEVQIQKLKERYRELSIKRNDSLELETQIRNEIIMLLANAQIIITYFDNLESKLRRFKTDLSQSLDYFYSLIESGNIIEEELLEQIEEDSESDRVALNKLMKSCAENLEIIQSNFLNKTS